jgi:hypothetical protein
MINRRNIFSALLILPAVFFEKTFGKTATILDKSPNDSIKDSSLNKLNIDFWSRGSNKTYFHLSMIDDNCYTRNIFSCGHEGWVYARGGGTLCVTNDGTERLYHCSDISYHKAINSSCPSCWLRDDWHY